jgi:hypothetical protein
LSFHKIKNALILGNKIFDGMTNEGVRTLVIRRCPYIETLDAIVVSNATRKAAEEIIA